MFPFPSQSATFSLRQIELELSESEEEQEDKSHGGRDLEQYFKASWPVFDPLFFQVCRDHQQQGIILLGPTGVCIAEMLRQIRFGSISGLQESGNLIQF